METVENKPESIECAGYCFNCLQMVFWNANRELVHMLTGESQCQLIATLKNEENQ